MRRLEGYILWLRPIFKIKSFHFRILNRRLAALLFYHWLSAPLAFYYFLLQQTWDDGCFFILHPPHPFEALEVCLPRSIKQFGVALVADKLTLGLCRWATPKGPMFVYVWNSHIHVTNLYCCFVWVGHMLLNVNKDLYSPAPDYSPVWKHNLLESPLSISPYSCGVRRERDFVSSTCLCPSWGKIQLNIPYITEDDSHQCWCCRIKHVH